MKRETIIILLTGIFAISILCVFPVVDGYIDRKDLRLRWEMSIKIEQVFERNKKHVDIAYSDHMVTYEKTSIPDQREMFLFDLEEWKEKYGDLESLYRINYGKREDGWNLVDISWSRFDYYDKKGGCMSYSGVQESWIFPYAVGYKKQKYPWSYEYMPSVKQAVREAFEFYTEDEKYKYEGFQEGCLTEIWHQLYDCENEYYYLKRGDKKVYGGDGYMIGNPLFEISVDSAEYYPIQNGYMYNGYYKVFIGKTQTEVWKMAKREWNPDEVEKKNLQLYWCIGLTVLALLIIIPLLVIEYKKNKIKKECLYERLIRLCKPSKYLKKYDREKIDKANSLYQSLLETNPEDKAALTEIELKAIHELGIKVIDKEELKDLANRVHPKHFMKPYNAEKLKIANDLYSRLKKDELTYEEFETIKEESKQL